MANVKLFRVTEFAESVFQSPLSHRTSLHPLWVMLGVALWIATVGHWPLWQTILLENNVGAASSILLLALAGQLLLSALIWLAPFGWRWSLKWAAPLLLLWVALGSCAMWLLRAAGEAVSVSPVGLAQFLLKSENWSRLLSLPCMLTLAVVFLVPALLIWRVPVRRIRWMVGLVLNSVVLVVSLGLLTLATKLVGHSLPSPLDPTPLLRILGLLQ
jgi:glucan phosphoethanolaminetransferase (alkaline phosphatase superfamily)